MSDKPTIRPRGMLTSDMTGGGLTTYAFNWSQGHSSELIRDSRRIVSESALIPKRTVPSEPTVGMHYSPAFAASVSTSAMFCIKSSGTLCLFCKYAGVL